MPPEVQKPAGPEAAGASAPVTRRRGVRALMVLCGAVLAAALVAGAAAVHPADTDANVLRGFQIRVLSISQAASENRMDGALAALQALEKDLGEAAAAGRVSAARYRGIENALSAVRADIATQVAAASAAEPPATAPDAGAAAPALADTAQDGPSPADPVVPAVAPAPAPAPEAPGSQRSDTAKEAKGKGKSQGKP